MEAAVRIGPWVHGELRNGGFPDWLLKKPFPLRNGNPGFMRKWKAGYRIVAKQLDGLYFKDSGPILAIQLENEMPDDAEYLKKLKELAIKCGMEVPLYTVTGGTDRRGQKSPWMRCACCLVATAASLGAEYGGTSAIHPLLFHRNPE